MKCTSKKIISLIMSVAMLSSFTTAPASAASVETIGNGIPVIKSDDVIRIVDGDNTWFYMFFKGNINVSPEAPTQDELKELKDSYPAELKVNEFYFLVGDEEQHLLKYNLENVYEPEITEIDFNVTYTVNFNDNKVYDYETSDYVNKIDDFYFVLEPADGYTEYMYSKIKKAVSEYNGEKSERYYLRVYKASNSLDGFVFEDKSNDEGINEIINISEASPNLDMIPGANEQNLGDINSDGEISLTDLTELSLAIIGDKTFTEDQLKAADINKNGKADLPDLARLQQYLSKKITSLG